MGTANIHIDEIDEIRSISFSFIILLACYIERMCRPTNETFGIDWNPNIYPDVFWLAGELMLKCRCPTKCQGIMDKVGSGC